MAAHSPQVVVCHPHWAVCGVREHRAQVEAKMRRRPPDTRFWQLDQNRRAPAIQVHHDYITPRCIAIHDYCRISSKFAATPPTPTNQNTVTKSPFEQKFATKLSRRPELTRNIQIALSLKEGPE